MSLTGLEIAVIGMAGRFPGADSVEEFWANVRNGVSAITTFTEHELDAAAVPLTMRARANFVAAGAVLDRADEFDAGFFGYSPRDAAVLDPQHRVFLQTAWHALEHAGYAGDQRAGSVGIYAGTRMSTYLLRHLLPRQDLMESLGGVEVILSNDKDTLATRTAYHFGLDGPAITVQSACSTSLVAVHLACQGLLCLDCDLAIAGGVSILLPQHQGYLHTDGSILSATGRCRPFDARADGVVGGNGAAAVVLKPLTDALRDRDTIHAVIKGTAVNNDASDKVGFTAPSVAGQSAVIRAAHEAAHVTAESLGYVEAHGTGTAMGDPIEVAALTEAFRASTTRTGFCALGSVKSLVGHLDAAAGVTGFIKAVYAVKTGHIPPNPYFESPNPALDLDRSPFYVNRGPARWPDSAGPRRAGVSSFGMGGTNAHVVLEQAPEPEVAADAYGDRSHELIVLSARTEEALDEVRTTLSAFIANHSAPRLADLAHTLRVGRRSLPYRLAVVCAGHHQAARRLGKPGGPGAWTAKRSDRHREVCFLFPGQGSQYPGMGRGIYQHESGFRRRFDECAELFLDLIGTDLRDLVLTGADGGGQVATSALDQTGLAQPALFSVEYALAGLWQDWGIRPRAMLGHSIGEYAAACLAGVFELPDAVTLVAERGRLMQGLPSGAMLAVQLGADELAPRLGADLSLAAANAPAMSTVSGPADAIKRLARQLDDDGIRSRPLRTSHAFHSAMMEPVIGAFKERAAAVRLRPPRLPFLSNVTGDWITPMQASDPGYWAQQIREPVRFSAGLQRLLADGPQILLEAGPGSTLTTLASQHGLAHAGHVVYRSIPRSREPVTDTELLMSTLGRLWLAGARVDFPAVDARRSVRRVPLPVYPFTRDRHWIDLPGSQEPAAAASMPDGLSVPGQAGIVTTCHQTTTEMPGPAAVLDRVRAVLRDMLGIPDLTAHDDFFEAGGHSLLAGQVTARLRELFGVPLPANTIFDAPTAARLAARVESALAEAGSPQSPEPDIADLLAEIRGLTPEALREALDREEKSEGATRP